MDVAEVVEVVESLDDVSEDHGYHLLLEPISERLRRVHDVGT